jgi:hypothetical protein
MQRTKNNLPEKRHRNVAHLWADKRVIRFFRKNFEKKDYKNLRSIYLALCEIESDFGENANIKGFTKTVSTYAGMGEDVTRKYLRALWKADLIDYYQENIEGRFGNTLLMMYKWEEGKESEIKLKIEKSLKIRSRKTPGTVNTGYGKSGSIKKDSKESSISKNSKESFNKKDFPKKYIETHLPNNWQDNPSFQETLEEFIQHRKEKKQPITELAGKKLANKLVKYSIQQAIDALNRSIENGWTGVFPENGNGKKLKQGHNRYQGTRSDEPEFGANAKTVIRDEEGRMVIQ